MKSERLFMKLTNYFVMDCISFTVLSLLLAALSVAGVVQNLNASILLQLFLCTTAISLTMFLTNRFFADSRIKELFAGIINGIFIVFVLGGVLFHWFPWHCPYLIMVTALFLISFLISYGIELIENRRMTDRINYILKEKRK